MKALEQQDRQGELLQASSHLCVGPPAGYVHMTAPSAAACPHCHAATAWAQFEFCRWHPAYRRSNLVAGCRCDVSPEGCAHMTARLQQVASTVMLLEGGYNLNSTAVSAASCMRVLLGIEGPALKPAAANPSPSGLKAIETALETQVTTQHDHTFPSSVLMSHAGC